MFHNIGYMNFILVYGVFGQVHKNFLKDFIKIFHTVLNRLIIKLKNANNYLQNQNSIQKNGHHLAKAPASASG